MISVSVPEVVRELSMLPPDKVAEVYDFVLFLKNRRIAQREESDEWSDDDQRDVTRASLCYAEATLLDKDLADDSDG
jgi:hypothetical protein